MRAIGISEGFYFWALEGTSDVNGLMTVTTATVDYIKLIPLIRAAVYVVIISWH